jgi:hypothetical protein
VSDHWGAQPHGRFHVHPCRACLPNHQLLPVRLIHRFLSYLSASLPH